MARPSLYRDEFAARAQCLAGGGATGRIVADDLGIGERTLHRWKRQWPDFGAAFIRSRAAAAVDAADLDGRNS